MNFGNNNISQSLFNTFKHNNMRHTYTKKRNTTIFTHSNLLFSQNNINNINNKF